MSDEWSTGDNGGQRECLRQSCLSLPYQLPVVARRICNEATVFEQSERLETGPHISTAHIRNLSPLLLIQKVQLDATICRHLFTAKSLYMFRASQHPSSGVLKTVTATSGIGHNTGAATSFQRGLIRPCWKEVAAPVLWPIPEVAVTVFSTPDDGCCDARNM